MEVEKKRKRGESSEEEEDDGEKKRKERGGKAEEKDAAPTEEEVEEFFAILRRMQVAVKYFKSNGAVDGRELTTAIAIETGVLRGGEGEDLKVVEKKVVDGVKETAVLDLNVIPDDDRD